MTKLAFAAFVLPLSLAIVALGALVSSGYGPLLEILTIVAVIAAAIVLTSLAFGRAARSAFQREETEIRMSYELIARDALKDGLLGAPVLLALFTFDLLVSGDLYLTSFALFIGAAVGATMLINDHVDLDVANGGGSVH